jgi:hypothetical protein
VSPLSALGGPTGASQIDTARVQRLLADILRLAVDQPVLENRIGELTSLLDQLLLG